MTLQEISTQLSKILIGQTVYPRIRMSGKYIVERPCFVSEKGFTVYCRINENSHTGNYLDDHEIDWSRTPELHRKVLLVYDQSYILNL